MNHLLQNVDNKPINYFNNGINCLQDQALLQHVVNSLNAMIENENDTLLDAESFYRLVLIVRGIAVARPQNLVKFADSHTSIQDVVLDDPLGKVPIHS